MANENYRVYWRILFDVIGGQERVRKELTLWDVIDRVRHSRIVVKLDCERVEPVTIHEDWAEFEGGYLKCTDSPLDLVDLLGAPSGVSEANEGENIAIWAEVDLPQYPDSGRRKFPLFYYPQADIDSFLALSVVRDAKNTRSIQWTIDGKDCGQYGQYKIAEDSPEDGAKDAGWHRVRVRQDQDPGSSENYFEFLADSIPFGSKGPINASFTFAPIDKFFYIGRVLDPHQPGGWHTLHGNLRQLEFDPNDSCMSCG